MHHEIRFVFVEDEPFILRQLESVIPAIDPRFIVAGSASNGREGLCLIREVKPDVVITDIQMPVMSGLEMIAQARETVSSCRYLVLTGFSEFAYARSALQLGVDDYLLKPIDPDDFSQKLKLLAQKLDEQYFHQLENYLRTCYFGLGAALPTPRPLHDGACHLFIATAGAATTRSGGELSPGATLWRNAVFSGLGELEARGQMWLTHFGGRFAGEHVFAAVCPRPLPSRELHKLAQELLALCGQAAPICIIATGALHTQEEMLSQAAAATLTRMTALPFGESGVLTLDTPLPPLPEPLVPPEFRTLAEQLSRHPESGRRDSELLAHLLAFWEDSPPCEAVLLRQLETLISLLRENGRLAEELTAAELTADAISFADVTALLAQFLNVSGVVRDAKTGAGAQVQQVKRFLDRHYAEPITYRVLYDTFGYNEKYIAGLFKKELGVTPSKYLVTVRIEMAKHLLSSQPELLQKDVAQQVGFSDPLYFSRVFREMTGISPSRFAKQCTDHTPPLGLS